MDREEIIATLRAHEPELRAAGVERLSLIGSVARGDQTERSGVDVAIRLSPEAADGGFAYFGRLDALTRRISEILGRPVESKRPQTAAAGHLDRVELRAGDPELRMRLLQRLRHDIAQREIEIANGDLCVGVTLDPVRTSR
jgi:uncharacterized protein